MDPDQFCRTERSVGRRTVEYTTNDERSEGR